MKDFRRTISQGLVAGQIVNNKRIINSGETIAKKCKSFVPLKIRQTQSAHQSQRDSRRHCTKCTTSKNQIRTN